jgi:hypothetical protein
MHRWLAPVERISSLSERMGIGVFVLGMHRSGTSLATRLINLLGVPAPIDEDLLPTDSGNPRGYWESASLVAFNDRLLGDLGSDMTCPIAFTTGWEDDPRLDGLDREAADAFARAFPGPHWVFKDPRNCITFPFWVRALDIQPLVILIHRNPCEIASSYRNHWGDGDGIPYLFALWERYLRQTLCHIEGIPVLVTSYEHLLAEPVAWSERARQFLSRSGVSVQQAPREIILDFVDAHLRHASFTRRDFLESTAVTDAQRALFLALEKLEGVHDSFVPPPLPPETATTDALLVERRRAVRIKRELPAERLSRAWQTLRSSAYLAPARRVYRGVRRLFKPF